MKGKLVESFIVLMIIIVFGGYSAFLVWSLTTSCDNLKETLPFAVAQNRCLR